MADRDPKDVARRKLLRTLLQHVERDLYPSTTMMDSIEELLTPEDLQDYVDVLISHIESENYPSTSMIERLQKLTV